MREGGRQRSKNDTGLRVRAENRDCVVFCTCLAVDQETLQPLFQHPAPGNWMALSGVIGRIMRRISSIS